MNDTSLYCYDSLMDFFAVRNPVPKNILPAEAGDSLGTEREGGLRLWSKGLVRDWI